jgi:hypothetical protein
MRILQATSRGALMLALSTCPLAWGQVPPHQPGTICFTPQFWCVAPVRGPVGAACACPRPNGWVRGKLG